MKIEPKFHAIEMNTWPMAQAFHYYTQMAPTTYTVNVMMDVTVLRATLKEIDHIWYHFIKITLLIIAYYNFIYRISETP